LYSDQKGILSAVGLLVVMGNLGEKGNPVIKYVGKEEGSAYDSLLPTKHILGLGRLQAEDGVREVWEE